MQLSDSRVGTDIGRVVSWTALSSLFIFFFFNDTATTEIYTLSLHDALPISPPAQVMRGPSARNRRSAMTSWFGKASRKSWRSEEHTSELQSQSNLVCRLLLEKKKNVYNSPSDYHCHEQLASTLLACHVTVHQ